MLKNINLTTNGWTDYELLDSGDGRKLERFGSVILDRPDPQALWNKTNENIWDKALARFVWREGGEKWSGNKNVPDNWVVSFDNITLQLSLGKFKHVGLFPEHASQWEEVQRIAKSEPKIRVLNLFGYTGAASLVAAAAGASVTHIDASKQTLNTLKENIKLSKLPENSIRTIFEDALKYSKRLITRGEKFEIILMDPPAFGRGPKGEVWKIEEKLQELLSLIPNLISDRAKLVILNGYAAGYSSRTFGELLKDVLPNGEVSYGDVGLKQKNSDRVLSTGIYSKWKPD